MGCQCMCRHREPRIPQTRSPFRYQGGEYIYKVAVIGDADTGKTSMLGKFARDDFNPTYIPTIGVDYRIRVIELDEVKIRLQLWDTAGQSRFRTITRAYYRLCVGIIITYDATKEKTFENVPYWIEETSKERYYPDAKIVLVGTNGDRVDEKVVDYTRVRDFASERQIPFFEVSSKDGTNVELAFMTLVAQLRQLQIEFEKK